MDEVDRIIASWQRERPDVDTSPMEIFSRLSRLAAQLNRLRKTAFQTHGLEAWEFDVLAALRRSGEPYELAPGQLIAATHVTSGTMTNRVDRLAGRGFVERSPAPNDRRGVRVRLTDAGRKRVDSALETLLSLESQILTSLPDSDQAAVATALRELASGAASVIGDF